MSVRVLRQCLSGALILGACSALAQEQRIPSFELERLQLNPGARDSLVLSTGDLLLQGQYRLALTGHWEHNPLVLLENGERTAVIVKDRLTAHVSGAYALYDWLELGAQVPLVGQWAGNPGDVGLAAPSSFALGTPWVQGRARLLSEANKDALDLGVHLGVALPLGSAEALTRDQGFTFTPRVGLGKQLGSGWRVGADVGALLRTKTYVLSPDTAQPRDELGVEINGGLNITGPLVSKVRGELLLRGTVPLARSPLSMEALLGLRAPVGPVEVYAMGGPGFGNTVGTPAFRFLAGVAYAPSDKPVCVEGQSYPVALCPELDADGDGVKNVADRCPQDAGLAQLDGCADTDDDGDGVLNLADRCPKEPENVNGFEDGDGCPDDPDSDGDGIADSKDRCPKEPEDKDGFQDEDGCPDPDNDGDGVADKDDSCPLEAGLAANKGCPDKDRDADTVVDRLDNCPDEPGTVQNNGCKQKQRVRIETGRLEILESVYFELNKDVIDPRSYKLLDNVASILQAHPEIEKMRVEGHTDNQGDAGYNTGLSQRRAEAVVKYLAGKGVARERLEAKGFGPTKPIAENTTKEGRAKNRRVEFHLVGDAQGVETRPGEQSPDTVK